MLYCALGLVDKTLGNFSTNEEQNQNKTRFPALCACLMYLPRVLTGSLRCLRLLCLVREITLLSVSRHLIENRFELSILRVSYTMSFKRPHFRLLYFQGSFYSALSSGLASPMVNTSTPTGRSSVAGFLLWPPCCGSQGWQFTSSLKRLGVPYGNESVFFCVQTMKKWRP